MALGIPVLIGVAVLLMSVILVGVRNLHMSEVARGMARDVARGDTRHAERLRDSLPRSARVTVQRRDTQVLVSISDQVHVDAPLLNHFRIPLGARSVAALEVEG